MPTEEGTFMRARDSETHIIDNSSGYLTEVSEDKWNQYRLE